MSKMAVKVLTAVIMIAVAVPVLYLGGIWMEILMAFIAGGAAYEAARLGNEKVPVIPMVLNFIAIVMLYKAPATHFAAVAAFWAVILFTISLIDEKFTTDSVGYNFMITLLAGMALRCLTLLYHQPAEGWKYFLFVGLACFGCDTGAYFFGVFLGKHKMIPRVSPNKTWEGSIGGYATGAIVSFVYSLFVLKDVLPVSLLAAASLLLPLVAQIGDLSFSSIKRRFGIKDFSNLFPGHGGVLDRVDSVIFCLMVFNALMIIWRLA